MRTRQTETNSNKPRARDIIDTASLIRVAVMADCDPRSVDKLLLGRPVRASVAARILAVLKQCGIEPLTPSSGTDEASR